MLLLQIITYDLHGKNVSMLCDVVFIAFDGCDYSIPIWNRRGGFGVEKKVIIDPMVDVIVYGLLFLIA